MTCIQCGAPTTIATGYALPFLYRTPDGAYQNLYACSRECRDAWRAAKTQVEQIQAELETAQHQTEDSFHEQ